MDEKNKYASFSIPRRDARSTPGAAPPAARNSLANARDAVKFAEIELEPDFSRARIVNPAPRQAPPRFPAQPIAKRAPDPLRDKFSDMRRLADGESFARDGARLFYRQAKFMADYTDNYDGDAKFAMYYPHYQQMGYEQLRVYFTWRTKVRQGDIQPTSVSYAFLYVYELLCGIGADGPADGLNKLLAIWDGFLKFGPALENYMPQWFKDYHIYHVLPDSFEDFIKEHNLHKYYPEMYLFAENAENSLELWNSISDYSVTASKFYKDGNRLLMGDCFNAVVGSIRELCESLNIHIEDLFVYRYSRVGNWRPFKESLFYPWLRQQDRKVRIYGQESYSCKDNHWTANIPIYYSDRNGVIGQIIKKMEVCLREAAGYKYKLKAEPCNFYRSSGTPIMLDGVIEKAVADFHRNLTRTVVTVDHAALARIREEARGTQDKLLVEEYENARPAGADCVRPPSPSPGEAGAVADKWQTLKAALTPVELRALTMALDGDPGVKAFADENGTMLELLADSINEKAADNIGDNILETDEGMIVFDEYKEELRRW